MLYFVARRAGFSTCFRVATTIWLWNRGKSLTYRVGFRVGVQTVRHFSRLPTPLPSCAYSPSRSRSRWCVTLQIRMIIDSLSSTLFYLSFHTLRVKSCGRDPQFILFGEIKICLNFFNANERMLG